MDRKSLINQLELAYAPLTAYEFAIVKDDHLIERALEKASLYIISHRTGLIRVPFCTINKKIKMTDILDNNYNKMLSFIKINNFPFDEKEESGCTRIDVRHGKKKCTIKFYNMEQYNFKEGLYVIKHFRHIVHYSA